MTLRLVYLIGGPGSGKSTLMARLTNSFVRLPQEHPVPHDQLVVAATGVVTGIEIGRRRAAFSGTDALGSTIIDTAEPWIATRPADLVLAEGARLGNRRFLTAAVDAGYDVTLALLDHDEAEAWRLARSASLHRTQNASWVRGRITASRNLADSPPEGVTVLRGHPDALFPVLEELT